MLLLLTLVLIVACVWTAVQFVGILVSWFVGLVKGCTRGGG